MAYHMYFSPVRQELQKEVRNHPELVELLSQEPSVEFEVRLAKVAKFCGILVDGEYTQQDVDNICALCLEELKKRSTLILPAGYQH